MAVRFFNDAGPDGEERLLIGTTYDEPAPPVAHIVNEAVRVATEEDVATYAAEYQTYVDSFAKPEEHHEVAVKPASKPLHPAGHDAGHNAGHNAGGPKIEPAHESGRDTG